MRRTSIIISLFLVSVFTQVNAGDIDLNKTSVYDTQSYKTTDIPNKKMDFRIDIDYSPEGHLSSSISRVQLTSNDSVSLIKVKTTERYFDNEDISVMLNKETVNFLWCFLYDLYSSNDSAIKDKYVNEHHLICPESSNWHIDLILNGKKITESFNIYDFLISFDEPFNIQFDRIRQLIYAITNKIERDILLENIKPEAEDWIIKIFHDEYFERNNNIDLNQ